MTMGDVSMDFAKTIRHLRDSREITIEKFSRWIGVATPTLWRYETGKTSPTIRRTNQILGRLGWMITLQPAPWSLERSVRSLGLSTRSRNCLKNNNINTLGDLIEWTETEIIRTPNFGRVSLTEIKERLAEIGLGFRVEAD